MERAESILVRAQQVTDSSFDVAQVTDHLYAHTPTVGELYFIGTHRCADYYTIAINGICYECWQHTTMHANDVLVKVEGSSIPRPIYDAMVAFNDAN